MAARGKTRSPSRWTRTNPPEFGGKVTALVEIDRLHLFDAETEQRIAGLTALEKEETSWSAFVE